MFPRTRGTRKDVDGLTNL